MVPMRITPLSAATPRATDIDVVAAGRQMMRASYGAAIKDR
jgi:hypothetical protein